MKMNSLQVFIVYPELVSSLWSPALIFRDAFIGANIGTELSDMPHPTQVVALLKAQQIRHVRLYDADRGMLVALANTGIKVAVSVPNEQLLGIGQSNSTAANWVSRNIPDATLENANTYNSNLIRHVLNQTGTPKHPGIGVSTYIYELYNEDNKPGPLSEKNWGLFDANGDPVYILHLTGSGSVLANDTTNQTYCTARDGADPKMLQAALDWACGPGKVDCSGLLQGQPCYEPDNVIAHATYAFDTYYHQMRKDPAACNFNGVAVITTSDPSHGSCIFPGSLGKNGTMANITAPSLNSTISDSSAYKIYGSSSLRSILTVIRLLVWGVVFL
ncbi:glucan endo-1,3-beta-glucosidase 2 [Citrus sinensis]|uniref:Glucan endo-1,3-beta-glucosidase 2 n=1 Tax=Citrus sinensis TaxID=2711 RepID=A0ACB8K2L8_CITSI|nr:glucan endo-1,3-beta-glucosidase 2 [Citrus sinensis]